jgi:UDP-glucose 4-epimerase
MAILITGGLGYIGSHLAVTLAKNHDIYLLDFLSKDNEESLIRLKALIPNKFIFLNVNLMNLDENFSFIEKCEIDLVCHCAVVKNKDQMRSYDANKNEMILEKIMLLVSRFNINKFIFTSSAAVYGNATFGPTIESQPLSPQSNYGKSKLLMENTLLEYANGNLEFCAVALRIFNVAGNEYNHIYNSSLIKNVANAANDNSLMLDINSTNHTTSDGTYIRDYIYISDVISAIDKSINFTATKKGFFSINIGTGTGTSVFELLDVFEKISRKKINFRVLNLDSSDVSISIANNNLAKKLLDWEPATNLSKIALNLLADNNQ